MIQVLHLVTGRLDDTVLLEESVRLAADGEPQQLAPQAVVQSCRLCYKALRLDSRILKLGKKLRLR